MLSSLVRNPNGQKLLLAHLANVNSKQVIRPLLRTSVRYASDDPMLTVGPYPRTKEERERAAKKYNLIPEDYEPYDEGDAFGDYPKLKAVGAYNRDPYDDFDDVMERRFYGEVFHKDADLYEWERIDPMEGEGRRKVPYFKLFCVFIGSGVAMPALYYFFQYTNIHINQQRKIRDRMPPGTKYYAFSNFDKSSHELHHGGHH